MADQPLELATASLRQIQEFEVSSLPRRAELGQLAFDDAVAPAERLVKLYSLIPLTILPELPDDQLNKLNASAERTFKALEDCRSFDMNSVQGPPGPIKENLIKELEAEYRRAWNDLHAIISFAGTRTLDIGRIEVESREVLREVRRETDAAIGSLKASSGEAEKILADVRQVAEEHGVSQQAIYFRTEATEHESRATKWRNATFAVSIAFGVGGALSVFAHKWDILAPENVYETIQLGISKALIFAALAYALTLCSRNFLANKHNAVVNRHRHNALVTFETLANATSGEGQRDVVLSHAAACIFAPQDSAFVRGGGGNAPAAPVVEVVPRVLGSTTPNAVG